MTRVVALLVAVLAACSGGTDVVEAEPGWGGLDDVPLDERSPAILEWTGDELVVWGGDTRGRGAHMVRVLDDGAAYDPATGRWRRLPSAPLDRPLYRPAAAWTGAELLLAGQQCGGHISVESAGPDDCDEPLTIVAYEPATDAWRALDTSRAPDCSPGSLTWTGEVGAFWCGVDLWSVDPEADEVQRAAAPEEVPENSWVLCGGGGRLAATMNVTNRELPGPRQPVLAATLDDDAWTEPAEVGVADDNTAQLACAGADVLAMSYGGGGEAHVFDPDVAAWRSAAAAPAGARPGVPVWTGDELLFLDPPAPAAYDLAADRWRPLPSVDADIGRAVWAGDAVVAVERTQWDEPRRLRFHVYDPGR